MAQPITLNSAQGQQMMQSGQAYRVIDPKTNKVIQEQGPQRGLLGNIAHGVIDPFYRTTQMLQEAPTLAASKLLGRDYDPMVMSQQEYDRFIEDPLLRGAQNIAGVASFAVPGGGAIPSMVAKGALAGGLAGFGAAEEPEDIMGSVKSGVLGGGLAAGALGIGGKLLGKAAGKARGPALGQVDDAINSQATKLAKQGMPDDEIARVLGTASGMDNARLNYITQNLQGEKAQKALGELIEQTPQGGAVSGTIDDLLAKGMIDQPIQPPGAVSKLGKGLSGKGKDMRYRQLGFDAQKAKQGGLAYASNLTKDKRVIGEGLEEFGLKLNSDGLSELAERAGQSREAALFTNKIDDNMSNIVSSLSDDFAMSNQIDKTNASALLQREANKFLTDSGIDQPLSTFLGEGVSINQMDLHTIVQGTQDDYWRIVSKGAGNASLDERARAVLHSYAKNKLVTKIPEYGKYNKIFSTLYKHNPGIIKAYNQSGLRQLAKANLIGQGTDVAQRLGAEGMMKGGQLLQGVGNVPGTSQVSNLLGKAGGINMSNRLAPLLGAHANIAQGQQPATPQAQSGMAGGMDQYSGLRNALGMQPSIGAGGAPAGVSTGGKALPATQVKDLSDMQDTLLKLDELEGMITGEYGGYFGPIQGGVAGDIAQSVGLSGERSTIQSITNVLAQSMGKALEGGKLTDADIERYRQMLPNLKDTPGNALKKLQMVRQMITQQVQSQTSGYQTAGYDPYAGAQPTTTAIF